MDLASDVVGLIESLDRRQYRAGSFPVAADEEFMRITDRLGQASGEEVEEVRDALGNVGLPASAWVEYARRGEALGMLEKSPDRIRSCLIAHALVWKEDDDPRDIMVALSTPHYAGELIGADVPELFDEASTFALPAVADIMRRFGRRTDVNPKTFMFELVDTARGKEFRTRLDPEGQPP